MSSLSGDAKKDSNLIGQFGVGFYSIFMVADRVDVVTKKAGEDVAYKFTTDGKGEFEITEVTKDAHGTVIYMSLKSEAKEFLDKWRVEEIIKKYSNHIPYPIFLNYIEEETTGEGDDKEVKKVKKSEQINQATALWRVPRTSTKER